MAEQGRRVGSWLRHRLGFAGRREKEPPLLLLLLLAAGIPILLFGALVAFFSAQEERARARAAAFRTAAQVADRIALDLNSQIEVLKALAASSALNEPDFQAFYQEAQRVRSDHPLWHAVELTRPSGVQVLNLLRPWDAPLGPTADQASFNEVLETRKPVIGGIGPVGSVSGRELIALRVPVLRDGALRYVLSTLLQPHSVETILVSSGAPRGWTGAVFDGKGRVIAQTRPVAKTPDQPSGDAVIQAIQKDRRAIPADGQPPVEVDKVGHTLPLAGGWSVHFGIPRDVLDAPVRRSMYMLAGAGVISLTLAFMLAGVVAGDLAERRRGEAARAARTTRLAEERGRVAIEAAELGTWRWDWQHDEITGSARCAALLGWPGAEDSAVSSWTSREFLGLVDRADRQLVEAAVRRCLDEDLPLEVEFRGARPEGGVRWLRAVGRRPRLGPDRLPVIYGVLADIDPRKRAEADRQLLLRRLAEAQENEQLRIARELHDEVGQTVTGLALGLKGLEALLARPVDQADATRRVQWLQKLTREVGRQIHRAAADLRPTALDDLGLVKALRAHAVAWQERSGIPVDLQIVGEDNPRLPAEIETAIYRITQEALTNVLKHAQARSVSIVLEHQPGQLRLVVEDDGVGFDPSGRGRARDANGESSGGLGLLGMGERLALVGGSLAVESGPGMGTALFVRIPLPANAERRAA